MSESGQTTPATSETRDARALPVDLVIERFGGIRPMAAKLDVPVTTVQGWKERGQIPERRWPEIEAAATRHSVSLEPGVPGGDATATPPVETPAPPALPPPAPPSASAGAPSPSTSSPSTPSPAESSARPSSFSAFASSARDPASDPPAPPRAPRPSRGGRLRAFAALMLLLLAAAAIAYVGWRSEYVRSRLPGGFDSAATDAVPSAPPVAPSAPAPAREPDVLADRLASLEAKMGDSGAIAALRAENERLAGEMTALKAQIAGFERERAARARQRERAQSFLAAVENLRAAAAGAGSYAPALDLVEAAVGDDAKAAEALQPLRARAERGVPTRQMLAARFGSVAADAMRSEAADTPGIWGKVAGQLSHLIVVRRTGARAPEGSVEAALSRAETALNAGDLAGAVSALDRLPEPAASTVAPWLEDARARLSLDRAVASLEARVVAIFATGEAEGKP